MSETLNKGKLGEIGENLVQTKLMQLGLNVINANTIMANYESVDLICVKPGNKKKVYVQVKTHKGHNFPIGITLAKCTIDYLEGKLKVHGFCSCHRRRCRYGFPLLCSDKRRDDCSVIRE